MNLTGFDRLSSLRSALLGSALALPMLGAGASAQEQADACLELEQSAEQRDFEALNISEDDLRSVIAAGEAPQCDTWLTEIEAAMSAEGTVTETEQARVRLEDEVVIEGRVIFDQQPPNVQVEEQPAEVIVGETTPEVSVTEGQAEILIRQAPPRIRFEMPQPTISIEQAAPEIIITMPDPTVDVANARPQVEVRQAEPRVSVTMAEPSIELDLYQAEDPENSPGIEIENRQATSDGATPEVEVTLSRAEAQVIYQEETEGGQQAEVTLSRSEPNVTIEQAEPEIEIVAASEPQVSWSQVGEATVTVQDSSQADNSQQSSSAQALSAEEDPAAGGEQADVAQSGNGPAVRREGYQGVEITEVAASDLDGATVFGVQDGEIGEIGGLRIVEGDAQEVIVDVGGFLGIGAREVRVPFTDMTLLQNEDGSDIRVYINATEDQLMSYPEEG